MIDKDYILVKTYAIREETSKAKGVGGKSIIIDTSWNPEFHVRNWAEVVQIPRSLSNRPIGGISIGQPPYFESGYTQFIRMNQISPDIKIGDTAYFHRNSVLSYNAKENIIDKKQIEPGKYEFLIRVRYNSIYCVIRDGKIIPIGSRVLVRPDLESWEDILMPVRAKGADGKPLIDNHGQPVFLPKEKWIQTKREPKHKALLGFVEHIGNPLKGEVCDLKPGNHIIYRKSADHSVKIEGKYFFPIKLNNIEAIIP